MPAERGIGLRCEERRMEDWAEMRARVSEMVVSGFDERRATRDSIAAMAGVRFGSLDVRSV